MYSRRGHNPNVSPPAQRARPSPIDPWLTVKRRPTPQDQPIRPISNEKWLPWDGTEPLIVQLPDFSDIRSVQMVATVATITVYAGAGPGYGTSLFTATAKNFCYTIPQGHKVLTLVSSAPFGTSVPVFVTGRHLATYANDSVSSGSPLNVTIVAPNPIANVPAASPSSGTPFIVGGSGTLTGATVSFTIGGVVVTAAQNAYVTGIATWGVKRQPLALAFYATTPATTILIPRFYDDIVLPLAAPFKVAWLAGLAGTIDFGLEIADAGVQALGNWTIGALITGYVN